MGQNPHFFFALNLPQKTKEELNALCDKLKGEFPFSRWVHELDFHITLAFLGHAEEDKLERAKNLVRRQICQTSFSLIIDHLGFFGRKDAPRIFWAGVQTEERLHIVRKQVFSACEEAGFELEARPFSPHITLARKWQGDQPFHAAKFNDEKMLSNPLIFTANDVTLYQTHLDKTPKYEAIASFPINIDKNK